MTRLASRTEHLPDHAATDRLAVRLSRIAAPGVCVLLDGVVGAGKTYTARATLQSLMRTHGKVEDVPSPTFTLVQTYQVGPLDIWHADLYRLTSPDELMELGLDAAFEDAFCLIEWPDRLGDLTPDSAVRILLTTDPTQPEARNAEISGPAELVAALTQQDEGVLS